MASVQTQETLGRPVSPELEFGSEAATCLAALYGALKAGRAMVHALGSRHPIEALGWGVTAVGGALFAGVLALDAVESSGANKQAH